MFAPFTMRIVTGEPPAATRLRAQSLIRCCVSERIGDVRLQRDAGARLFEAGAIERSHEDLGREGLCRGTPPCRDRRTSGRWCRLRA